MTSSFKALLVPAAPSLSQASVLPIALAVTSAVLHYKTGDHGDSRIDSFLSGILVYWALVKLATIDKGASAWRAVVFRALGTMICLLLITMSFGLVAAPAALNTTFFDNAFPVAALCIWWALATKRSDWLVFLKVVTVVAITVSLWLSLWDLAGQAAGRLLIESTIAGATQLLYWFGHDVSRSADMLRLNTGAIGSVDVLLGCTGLPIFRLLLKIIIVDTAVLGQKKTRWYVEAILTAFAITMAIGPLRVAVLTAAAGKGNRSFLFWHGDTGVALFSALGFLAFLLIAGRLDSSPKQAISAPESQNQTAFT